MSDQTSYEQINTGSKPKKTLLQKAESLHARAKKENRASLIMVEADAGVQFILQGKKFSLMQALRHVVKTHPGFKKMLEDALAEIDPTPPSDFLDALLSRMRQSQSPFGPDNTTPTSFFGSDKTSPTSFFEELIKSMRTRTRAM